MESGYQSSPILSTRQTSVLSSLLVQVYGWMALGLLITFAIALIVNIVTFSSPQLLFTVYTVFPFVLIFQLVVVLVLSFLWRRLSALVSGGLFIVYSILTGVFVGVITVNYEAVSVLLAFGATFLTFIALSAYGYFTKQDLTKWGSIALMGLVGAILVSIFNFLLFFIAPQLSNVVYWIVNYVVMALFIILIAYDTQKLKALAIEAEQRGGSVAAYAIQGALMLYLDFINLFLRILSIMGKKR